MKKISILEAIKRVTNEDYSTSEIKTGKKWIDGKPIYRKCIQFTSILAGVVFSIDDIDTCISIGGFSGRQRPINFSAYGYYQSLRYQDDGTFFSACSEPYAGWNCLAIIEYTKTTDNGGV